jgi:hypothetical protein
MARVSSSNIPAESDMHAASASTSSSPTPSDASSPHSPSEAPVIEHRNQAPGIPDRRKSVRPISRSQSRHRGREARKSKASPLSMSLANMGSAMKLRDDDDDEDETPGEKSVGDIVCAGMLEHGPNEQTPLTSLRISRTPSKMPLTHPGRLVKRKKTHCLHKAPSPRVWESRAQAPRSSLARRQRKP